MWELTDDKKLLLFAKIMHLTVFVAVNKTYYGNYLPCYPAITQRITPGNKSIYNFLHSWTPSYTFILHDIHGCPTIKGIIFCDGIFLFTHALKLQYSIKNGTASSRFVKLHIRLILTPLRTVTNARKSEAFADFNVP